uniref:C2H2-type domain-containing protein n=1 Tax=Salarias fasciatus TaxID=181472 RepID=A0A672F436_SALFA
MCLVFVPSSGSPVPRGAKRVVVPSESPEVLRNHLQNHRRARRCGKTALPAAGPGGHAHHAFAVLKNRRRFRRCRVCLNHTPPPAPPRPAGLRLHPPTTAAGPGRRHACPVCRRTFSTKDNLRVHARRRCSGRFRCSRCSKTFKTSRTLKTHLRVHSRNPAVDGTARVPQEPQDTGQVPPEDTGQRTRFNPLIPGSSWRWGRGIGSSRSSKEDPNTEPI